MVEQQLASIELMKAQQEDYLIKNTLKIQDKKLKNQKYIFNGNLIFLFVLLIFSLGLYKIYNKLKTNNRDKEFLFNEMHFRVNENLHLISEMMKLQSQSLTDKNTLNVMREVQNRIDVMYLIQQQLSLQNKESVIEMTNYITILAMTIIDSFGKKNLIKFSNSNVKLYLKVDLAVKIGLIVNELITNSLKHGFPDQSKGEIEIICEMQKSKKLYIKVKDNGIGSAGKFPQNIISSFGSSLIEMLSQKLNGLMEVTSDEGYCTEFYFDLQ